MGGGETYPPAAEASATADAAAQTTTINVGGEECATYDDAQHKKIRAAFGVPEDFLASFDWSKGLKPGGGKGGNLMGFTPDRTYIVKEVNETDHKMMCTLAAAYCEHLLAPEGSLLTHMYAHIQRPKSKKRYLVMNNCIPDASPDPAKQTKCIYDLKGCADDKTMLDHGVEVPAVHKRFSKPAMWCGTGMWSKERHTYFQGKVYARKATFAVSPASKEWLMLRIARDCGFLKEHKCARD